MNRLLRFLLWGGIAVLAAISLGAIAIIRGDSIRDLVLGQDLPLPEVGATCRGVEQDLVHSAGTRLIATGAASRVVIAISSDTATP